MEENCVFCKIVKGEIPANVVYEDDNFLALLDIYPSTKGHSLIIPKKHFKWTYDVPNFGDYFVVAKRVGKAAQKAFSAQWIHFATYGVDIPHAHIHVVPRYKDDPHGTYIDPKKSVSFNEEEMKEIARKIKESIL